jgi:hypothetical protein
MTKSNSIPIAITSKGARNEAKQQLDAAKMADFNDYLFCSRLVNGMKERQRDSCDVGLRYQNQALIDHIVCTRNSPKKVKIPEATSLRSSNRIGDSYTGVRAVASCVQTTLHLIDDSKEDLMFQMDI